VCVGKHKHELDNLQLDFILRVAYGWEFPTKNNSAEDRKKKEIVCSDRIPYRGTKIEANFRNFVSKHFAE
jgi:hypothetical protein